MKYKALYVEEHQYELALKEACERIAGDTYYRRYGGATRDGVRFGTALPEAYGEKAAFIAANVPMQWTTCAGNRAGYVFDHEAKTVVFWVDSRRHGIPLKALAGEHPAKVLEYITQEHTWNWWETADNYEADNRLEDFLEEEASY